VSEDGLIPLGFMRPGESGTLAEIRGLRHHVHEGTTETHAGPILKYHAAHKYHTDRGHRVEHRLVHMGLSPGQSVTVVRNVMTGPVIVAVKDTRIGIARGIAARIYVKPDAPDAERGGRSEV
jgi:Fe2+ transport system protein FeoA